MIMIRGLINKKMKNRIQLMRIEKSSIGSLDFGLGLIGLISLVLVDTM